MGFNLDGDCVATMEEIDRINNDTSCIDIFIVSKSKLVGVDCSISSVYFPIIDDIFLYLKILVVMILDFVILLILVLVVVVSPYFSDIYNISIREFYR